MRSYLTEEKIKELYQEHLNEKLDLIFNVANGISFENTINSNFVTIYDYKDDYAIVEKNGKYNFVDTNGKLMIKIRLLMVSHLVKYLKTTLLVANN